MALSADACLVKPLRVDAVLGVLGGRDLSPSPDLEAGTISQ